MSRTFYGRAKELAQLRAAFEQVAARDRSGKSPGPRMVFVVAETGYGKSRLVQELYLQLTEDERWDPAAHDYWPPAFGDLHDQLRVNPEMRGHAAKGPPRFMWLGVRWLPTDVRNLASRRSSLPELQAELEVHMEVVRRHEGVWAKLLRAGKKHLPGEAISTAIDAMPGGNWISLCIKATKVATDLTKSSLRDGGTHDAVSEQIVTSLHDALLEKLRAALHGPSGMPMVLWLDDAQWIDSDSIQFVQRLWRDATTHHWPLLIVGTHWEREWRELMALDAEERAATLAGQAKVAGECFTELRLGKSESQDLAAYVRMRLPGLTAAQRTLLLGKADGNFLSMVENVGDLLNEPLNFVDGDPSKALAPEGEEGVGAWESDRQKRIEQRFRKLEPAVKSLLGWSSQLGVRFLHEVVVDYAQRIAQQRDAHKLLATCESPLVILETPNKWMREFRDKAFHLEASKHFRKFGAKESARLSEVLREHLVAWIQRSFGSDGHLLDYDEEDPSTAPEASVLALLAEDRTSELRDLLDTALKELPIPARPDWSDAATMAALRAIHLSVRIDAAENLWDRVRSTAASVERLNWSAVPESVFGAYGREAFGRRLSIAGLPALSLSVRHSRLALLRGNFRSLELDPELGEELLDALSDCIRTQAVLGDLSAARALAVEAVELARSLSNADPSADT
ncbi:MAG: ATP-binding protein, partial [Planctomycetes bacterium]|nr:ATP-binding protein [Planctomycetota bacterium]